MKRTVIVLALLWGGLWLAPASLANTKASVMQEICLELPGDFTPQQVRRILRKTRQITGIPMWRLVRKYLRGRLFIDQLADGTIQVTILRAGGDPIIAIIEDAL